MLIAPFFYHPDIKSQLFHCQYLSHGVVNIYDFVDKNRSHLPYPNIFVYLPFTYYFFGAVDYTLHFIYPHDLYTWLNDWGEHQNSYPNMILFMFVLKLPYLLFDILIGILIYKIYKSKKLLIAWLFNPLSIYLIYILGNFDVIPAFLTLLSFYFIKENKILFSYLSIGIAIALKMYPIMFLPFIFFYSKENIFRNIKYSVFSMLPILFSILPFLNQKSFYDSFFGSGLTQKILEFRVLEIPLFPVLFIFILVNYLYSKSEYKFEIGILQTFLIFIGLVKFHPQWIMWFLPFIIIFIFKSKINIFLSLLYFSFVFLYILLINDNYLFWGHLIPIDPNFINQSSPYQLIKLRFNLDPDIFRSQIHQILFIFGLIISFIPCQKKFKK